MAIFGEQNYGTPFGALKPSDFFDPQGNGKYSYSGFSSRSGASGFSGTGAGYSGFCGPAGLAFLPFKPTLTYPLNYAVLQGVVTITWSPASPLDPCDSDVSYEIQYTRTLSRDSGWRTLATNAKGNSWKFDVSQIAYTSDGGLRIRARNSKKLVSEYSQTVEAFTIGNHAPNPVTLVNPTSGQSIDNNLIVSWIEANPRDIDGQAVTYEIEFTSSYSTNTGWVTIPGAGTLPEGTTSFTANTFNLPDGEDYGIRVSAIDDLGLASIPRSAGPLSISHSGAFIIDTIPPTGSLAINDGAVLASGTAVRLSVFGYDAGTGIKDVRFGNEGDSCWSSWEPYLTEKFWELPKSDGIKRVFVQYRDYAENISSECDCEIVSKVLCAEGNVTDIEVFNNKLYMSFDKHGNLMEYRVLVAQSHEFQEDSVTSLAKFGGDLYAATYDGSEAFVYKFDGKAVQVFSLVGEKIVSMLAYNGNLYAGSVSGKIFEYTGQGVSTSYSSALAIEHIRTDGKLLYVSTVGGSSFLTFDGIDWTVNST